MLASKPNFDSITYQRYVSDIRNLVTSYSKINQDIIDQSRNYAKESYDSYQQHIKSLLEASNPMDYYRLNRSYLQESSSRFVRLVERRNKLFDELNQKLSKADSLMFLFPQTIQDAFTKYRETGVIEMISPDVWNSFTEKLTG